jgi:hypothetical protein
MDDDADAFAGGDYLSAARQCSADTWQYWASLGLVAHPTDAAGALQRFAHPHAAFFSGVASWIAGDDDRARHILAGCENAHARRLADLIGRGRITILAQLPWNRRGPWDILTHLKDPVFQLLNVSFHHDDIKNQPYADARTLIPDRIDIDFFVAEMVEWHLIPPNIRTLGVPVIGHTSDFDLHIQAIAPWLDLCDEIIVLDSVEWREMRRIVDVPVSVFPKVFGVPVPMPSLRDHERDIDVFLSGTVNHPYHPDKDSLIHDVLGVPDIRLQIVQGFDRIEAYHECLARSKMTCSFVRHAGAMPTRGLEALAMGCAIAVQEESALRLFGGESEGIVPYGPGTQRPAAAIAHVLARWSDYSVRARAGAAMVRREFALDRVASQYLRFLTFLAARPRAMRPGADPDRLVQKRPVVHRGWLPSNRFGSGVLVTWAAATEARLERRLASEETPGLLNDLARERLLAHYHDQSHEWLDTVVTPLQRAVERFPAALVARFNLVRVLIHFGDPKKVRRGLKLLDDTLRSKVDWHVELLDDVLPWDFCPLWFNYRSYFDAVTRAIGFPNASAPELVQLILASLNHYRARYADEIAADLSTLELAAEAVRLDPQFLEYSLYHCKRLLTRADPADLHDVSARLQKLASRSIRLLEILEIARQLPPHLRGEWYEDLSTQARRLWSATRLRENLFEPALRSASEVVASAGVHGAAAEEVP